MHYDRIRAVGVDGMRDVTAHILNVSSFTFVFFAKWMVMIIVFIVLLIHGNIQAFVIGIFPKFLPSKRKLFYCRSTVTEGFICVDTLFKSRKNHSYVFVRLNDEKMKQLYQFVTRDFYKSRKTLQVGVASLVAYPEKLRRRLRFMQSVWLS